MEAKELAAKFAARVAAAARKKTSERRLLTRIGLLT